MTKTYLSLAAALMLASAVPALAAGELTYVVNNESATFDPSTSTETFALPVIGATFEGLVKYAPDGSVVQATNGDDYLVLRDAVVVIVTAETDEKIRVISMRKAERNEQEIYYKNIR